MDAKKSLFYGLLIAVPVWGAWWLALGRPEIVWLLRTHWPVSLTMVFGSLVAGATSTGGGVVAFPVFTEVLHIAPVEAKLFSLAIQSVGMTAASLLILVMRVPIERRVVLWASLGGLLGMLFGAGYLVALAPPAVTKMAFTVVISTFGLVLFVINRGDRVCHDAVPADGWRERLILVLVGCVGGMVSSLVGTGIDVVTFSVVVLLFSLSEKVATPTSVIVMAINSVVGVAVFSVLGGGFGGSVMTNWLAAVPVVVLGAPLGALVCVYLSRVTIANLLVGLIAMQLITAIVIIPLHAQVIWSSGIGLVVSSATYLFLMKTKRYRPVVEGA